MLSALSGEMICGTVSSLSLVFVQSIVAARIFRKYCRLIIQTHAPCFLRVSNTHRRTGRHFTGVAEKICLENNNLP